MYSDALIEDLGGRADDYKNHFTARMLILLEGAYLYGDGEFQEIRNEIIGHYFNDFHTHSDGFRPIFLLNDILRFWRTLCINYEHKRHWRREDAERRAKGHLDNLKLKMSRLLMCYSFIGCLLSREVPVTPDRVAEICNMTPIQRMQYIGTSNPEVSETVSETLVLYAEFLARTGRHKSDVLKWIAVDDERNAAFAIAHKFIENLSSIVLNIATKNGYLRYLVI